MRQALSWMISWLKKYQKKLSNPKTIVALIAFFLALTFFKRTLMFFIIILLSIAFAYFNGMLHPPVDLSPFFFFSIITSAALGLKFGLLYYFIGAVIPWIALGGRIDASSLIYILMNSLFCLIADVLAPGIISSMLLLGITVTLLQAVFGVFIKTRLGVPVPDIMKDVAANIIVNGIYFFYFGNLFYNLLTG